MIFTWFDNTASIISFIVQGCALLFMCVSLGYTFSKVSKRKEVIMSFFLIMATVVVFFVFQYMYAFLISLFILILISYFAFMSNIGDVRKYLANPFSKASGKTTRTVQKITDKRSLFNEVQKAVTLLSDRKIGALITFEKNTNLNDICKNGVAVGAPFTTELIDTIFYPGTRLHDGAVIVRDGMIATASVFFTPTTKPFAVKYGSRHRAALGISEISDAVTIVVSEETGLVSIAHEGSIEHIEVDRLANTMINYF